jgi:hypothetical protein
MKPTTFATIALVICICATCYPDKSQQLISSGKIEYSISYLNKDLDSKMIELLPKQMRLLFNEDQAINYIDGFLGFYKINTITNFNTRKCMTLLKVFDKHYIFKGRRDELMCCFDDMKGMEIQETGEVKDIAGLPCKRAVIKLPGTDETFDIYYTGEINLKHPNATNPYKNIDGVLMEFELHLLFLKMRFTAENFQPHVTSVSQVEIPGNSKEISRDQMTQILSRLLD